MLNLNWYRRSGEENNVLKSMKEKTMKNLSRGTLVLLIVGVLAVLGSGAVLAQGPYVFEQI